MHDKTMTATFVEKFSSGTENDIFLVKAFDFTGQNCWYFVKISKSRSPQFSALIARGDAMNLEEYGTVLVSGYGNIPPPSAYEQARKLL